MAAMLEPDNYLYKKIIWRGDSWNEENIPQKKKEKSQK